MQIGRYNNIIIFLSQLNLSFIHGFCVTPQLDVSSCHAKILLLFLAKTKQKRRPLRKPHRVLYLIHLKYTIIFVCPEAIIKSL